MPSEREQAEVDAYVSEQWARDNDCLAEMDYARFHRALFRLAHGWCINLDVVEYAAFLHLIYDRVTARRVSDGSLVLPRILVKFPAEEDIIFEEIARIKAEEQGAGEAEEAKAEWESCMSDESQDSRY